VFECYGDGMVLRLVEDGYINYENGNVEIGLLRDCGNAIDVRSFDDGTVYLYSGNVCNNGVYVGNMPVVYSGIDQVFATATVGSILLTLVGEIHEM